MLDRWGKEDEKVLTESIEALKNESQHMKELVEQLLFLARGDSGRNTLNKVKLDLNQMVSEVWEESQMIDGKHRYLFRGTDPAYMTGDIAMIKQSIRIFVQNAAKYSSDDADIILGVMLESGYVSYMIQDEESEWNRQMSFISLNDSTGRTKREMARPAVPALVCLSPNGSSMLIPARSRSFPVRRSAPALLSVSRCVSKSKLACVNGVW